MPTELYRREKLQNLRECFQQLNPVSACTLVTTLGLKNCSGFGHFGTTFKKQLITNKRALRHKTTVLLFRRPNLS
ncbi:unnamed protein product [Bubo scandiacus]